MNYTAEDNKPGYSMPSLPHGVDRCADAKTTLNQ